MINRTVLVGRLTRDVELRYTANGNAVASFTVAVNRTFTNSQGEREADFINVVMWRKAAENFANFTHKGSLVGIDGRIQTRTYENDQGNRVFVTEVVAENFSLLEPKSHDQEQGSRPTQQQPTRQEPTQSQPPLKSEPTKTDIPPRQKSYEETNGMNANGTYGKQPSSQSNDPFANNGTGIDISDDDLPF